MERKAISVIMRTVADHALIEKGMHVVVGLSGGPDSTCLFHALAALRETLGFGLSAVHVNHGLRPGDAERDARFAEELCLGLGARFFGFERDVRSLAPALGVGEEEAGRGARYEAFFETAARVAAEGPFHASRVRVAVAHNRNDQAETVLMRIIRGTGPDGLAAMPYIRESREGFAVIRPLLDVPRDLVEEYCAAAGLSPARDLSNEEPVCVRNKIRLSLLPALESGYNGNIVEALVRLAAAAAEDRGYFDAITDEPLAKCRLREDGRVEAPLALFAEAHAAPRRRLIVKCFEMAGLSRDIAAVHLRAADALIRGGRDGKVIDFPNGYRLSLRDGNLSFFKSDGESPGRGVSRAAPPERTLRLDAFLSDTESPGRTERVFSVDAGPHVVEFSLRPASGRGETASRSEPGRAASHILLSLDFDLLMAGHGEISVRGRRAGDWIRPAGMDGRKLIQDLFVDAKLPRENRDAVPLITAGSEALCVLAAGRLRRTTGNYAVTPATARTLLVRLRDGADSK